MRLSRFETVAGLALLLVSTHGTGCGKAENEEPAARPAKPMDAGPGKRLLVNASLPLPGPTGGNPGEFFPFQVGCRWK